MERTRRTLCTRYSTVDRWIILMCQDEEGSSWEHADVLIQTELISYFCNHTYDSLLRTAKHLYLVEHHP